jgi:hypothetical protein
LVIRAQYEGAALHQPTLRPAVWPWRAHWLSWLQSGLFWLVIVALCTLRALPCVVHCDSSHGETATTGGPSASIAWFLCDLPASSGLTGDQAGLHHHHPAPQPPFEPALAFAGVVAATLLLAGWLPQRLCHHCLPLLSAPPTPPPRLSPSSTILT